MFYVNYISVRKREKEKGGWGNGNGNPLQYSCLENPRDGEAWWAAICGVTQSRTRLKRLSSSSSSSSSSIFYDKGFPGGSDSKEFACNVGDLGSIPRSGRSPGEGDGAHSSVLAWRIPGTGKPGGLPSMRSHRVGHD